MTFLARAGETGGNCSVLVLNAQRGSEPPPHHHRDENEIFFVLDGELEVFCEGAAANLRAKPGELILVPQRQRHALHYRSDHIRMLIILQSPRGRCATEDYFVAVASGPAETMRLQDGAMHYQDADAALIARARCLASQNGIELLSPAEAAELLPGYAALCARGAPADGGVAC